MKINHMIICIDLTNNLYNLFFVFIVKLQFILEIVNILYIFLLLNNHDNDY
jgi:hypothetical protein